MKYNVIIVSSDESNGTKIAGADGSTEFDLRLAEGIKRNRTRLFGGGFYSFKIVAVQS